MLLLFALPLLSLIGPSPQSVQADEIDDRWIYLPIIQVPLPRVLIREFMASNTVTLYDEDGDASDWIELHNRQQSIVRLEGWYLTDDPADLTKWRLPYSELPPDGRLLVFASGKGRTDAKKPLHTNFRLNSRGEYLALIAADGKTVVFEYATGYPIQSPDVSYGVDSRGNQRYFLNPTLRMANGSGSQDQGPALTHVLHTPQIPNAHEDLIINATVALDEEPVEEFNLNSTYSDKAYIRQVLAGETYRDAGVPSSISFPLRVHRNGKFYENASV